jgi:UDP-3-O-acyl-N-acetylglucosamine deacetylase
VKSGHTLNHALVRKVLADRTQFSVLRAAKAERERDLLLDDELDDSLSLA